VNCQEPRGPAKEQALGFAAFWQTPSKKNHQRPAHSQNRLPLGLPLGLPQDLPQDLPQKMAQHQVDHHMNSKNTPHLRALLPRVRFSPRPVSRVG
jgi:hypothetical protein